MILLPPSQPPQICCYDLTKPGSVPPQAEAVPVPFPVLGSLFLFSWPTCACHNLVLRFNYPSERPSLTTQSEVALSTNHITPVTLAYFIYFVFTYCYVKLSCLDICLLQGFPLKCLGMSSGKCKCTHGPTMAWVPDGGKWGKQK